MSPSRSLLLASCGLATALHATCKVSNPFNLRVLPFPTSSAMLPGEVMKFKLIEPEHERMICEILSADKGERPLFGQLIFRNPQRLGDTALAAVPLLQVVEMARRGKTTWVRVKCIGRTSIAEEDAALELDVSSTLVKPMVDLPRRQPASDDARTRVDLQAARLRADIDELFQACVATQRRLHVQQQEQQKQQERENQEQQKAVKQEQKAVKRRPSPLPLLSDEVWWSRDSCAFSSGRQDDESTIAALAQHRASVLRERGMDVAPAAAFDDFMLDLWGVTTDAELEQQLESYAAFATLGAKARMRALHTTCSAKAGGCTDRRVAHARRALGQQLKRLQAKTAVNDAMAGILSDGSGGGGAADHA